MLLGVKQHLAHEGFAAGTGLAAVEAQVKLLQLGEVGQELVAVGGGEIAGFELDVGAGLGPEGAEATLHPVAQRAE